MKYALTLAAALVLCSCEAPGYRAAQERVIRPAEVASFDVLYAQNCSACHGAKGEGALTVGIGSPVYLAIADDSTIRGVIQKGRRGTPMSAFARNEGGMLTDAQIEILVAGIRRRWGHALKMIIPRHTHRRSPAMRHTAKWYSRNLAPDVMETGTASEISPALLICPGSPISTCAR